MRFFTDSTSSGKTTPSAFLHKQLDVTPWAQPGGDIDADVIMLHVRSRRSSPARRRPRSPFPRLREVFCRFSNLRSNSHVRNAPPCGDAPPCGAPARGCHPEARRPRDLLFERTRANRPSSFQQLARSFLRPNATTIALSFSYALFHPQQKCNRHLFSNFRTIASLFSARAKVNSRVFNRLRTLS